MSIAETALVFIGIPLAVAVLIAALVYGGGRNRSRRYRPGRPYEFAPVWFVSAPDRLAGGAAAGSRPAHLSVRSASKGELAASGFAGDRPVLWPGEGPHGETGGASDRW